MIHHALTFCIIKVYVVAGALSKPDATAIARTPAPLFVAQAARRSPTSRGRAHPEKKTLLRQNCAGHSSRLLAQRRPRNMECSRRRAILSGLKKIGLADDVEPAVEDDGRPLTVAEGAAPQRKPRRTGAAPVTPVARAGMGRLDCWQAGGAARRRRAKTTARPARRPPAAGRRQVDAGVPPMSLRPRRRSWPRMHRQRPRLEGRSRQPQQRKGWSGEPMSSAPTTVVVRP